MPLTKQDLENIAILVQRKNRESEERILNAFLRFGELEKRIGKLEKLVDEKS